MSEQDAIEFVAEVYKVQTLVDGGIRLTLDLPESGVQQMAELAKCQQNAVLLIIRASKQGRQYHEFKDATE